MSHKQTHTHTHTHIYRIHNIVLKGMSHIKLSKWSQINMRTRPYKNVELQLRALNIYLKQHE